MVTEEKSGQSKFWPWLFLILGVFKLIDWLYGGRTDFYNAMSGVGFLLISPAAFADSYTNIATRFHDYGRGTILRPMMYIGTVLALAGIVIKWV